MVFLGVMANEMKGTGTQFFNQAEGVCVWKWLPNMECAWGTTNGPSIRPDVTSAAMNAAMHDGSISADLKLRGMNVCVKG